MKILRAVAGVILGYGLMVICITLVQEVWLGGVSFEESSLWTLILAGGFTFLCAMAGGAAGSMVVGGKSRVPAIIMSIIVVAETTALVITGRLGDPLWFDVSAAGSLIAGILIGSEIMIRWKGVSVLRPSP